jgi:pre-mRNA-splicing factor SYF1
MAAVVASKAQLSALDDLMPTDDDLLYEEELLRNPYSLKMWWRYIQARSDAAARRRYVLYERALKALPGSYKLWAAYLKERRLAVRGTSPAHPARASLHNTYERALVSMHKMPRVWLDYLELLLEAGGVTGTRRAFDRALAALPITQHDRVWVLYLVSCVGASCTFMS